MMCQEAKRVWWSPVCFSPELKDWRTALSSSSLVWDATSHLFFLKSYNCTLLQWVVRLKPGNCWLSNQRNKLFCKCCLQPRRSCGLTAGRRAYAEYYSGSEWQGEGWWWKDKCQDLGVLDVQLSGCPVISMDRFDWWFVGNSPWLTASCCRTRVRIEFGLLPRKSLRVLKDHILLSWRASHWLQLWSIPMWM